MQFDGHLLFNFNDNKKKKIKKCFFQKNEKRKENRQMTTEIWWNGEGKLDSEYLLLVLCVYVPLDVTNH